MGQIHDGREKGTIASRLRPLPAAAISSDSGASSSAADYGDAADGSADGGYIGNGSGGTSGSTGGGPKLPPPRPPVPAGLATVGLALHRKLPGGRVYRGVAADAPLLQPQLEPTALHTGGNGQMEDLISRGGVSKGRRGSGAGQGSRRRRRERPAPHAGVIPEPVVLGHPRAVEALRLSARQGHLALVEGESNAAPEKPFVHRVYKCLYCHV